MVSNPNGYANIHIRYVPGIEREAKKMSTVSDLVHIKG